LDLPSVVESFLAVRQWRIVTAEPSGLLMWFDPLREIPLLRSTLPDGDCHEQAPPASSLIPWEHMVEGRVVPDEGSDSEEVPEGVQKTDQLAVLADRQLSLNLS